MLNICISLAKLPRVYSLDVCILRFMAGELSRNKAIIESDKAAVECMLSLIDGEGIVLQPNCPLTIEALASELKSKWAKYHINYLTECRQSGWLPSELALDVLSGEGEELATISEINRLLENPVEIVRNGYWWPYVYVSKRAAHAGQIALNQGNLQEALMFAAMAISSVNQDYGTGIGDENEIPEALGLLLAHIAIGK